MTLLTMTIKPLLIITGPTGTGKTELGLSILQELSGEVISADSRQVYCGFDHITNKISCSENEELGVVRGKGYWIQRGIKINLYDVCRLEDQFSASEFVQRALLVLNRVWQEEQLPVIIGGTGFYLAALLGDMPMSTVKPNPKLRSELEKCSLSELQTLMQGLDHRRFENLNESELGNAQRLKRYIEIAQVGSFDVLSEYSPLCKLIQDDEVEVMKLALIGSRSKLYAQADHWLEGLVKSGQLEKDLNGCPLNQLAQSVLGRGLVFGPAIDWYQNKTSRDIFLQTTQGQLHRFIRHQLNWLRRGSRYKEVDIDQEGWRSDVARRIGRWYDGKTVYD